MLTDRKSTRQKNPATRNSLSFCWATSARPVDPALPTASLLRRAPYHCCEHKAPAARRTNDARKFCKISGLRSARCVAAHADRITTRTSVLESFLRGGSKNRRPRHSPRRSVTHDPRLPLGAEAATPAETKTSISGSRKARNLDASGAVRYRSNRRSNSREGSPRPRLYRERCSAVGAGRGECSEYRGRATRVGVACSLNRLNQRGQLAVLAYQHSSERNRCSGLSRSQPEQTGAAVSRREPRPWLHRGYSRLLFAGLCLFAVRVFDPGNILRLETIALIVRSIVNVRPSGLRARRPTAESFLGATHLARPFLGFCH